MHLMMGELLHSSFDVNLEKEITAFECNFCISQRTARAKLDEW